MQYPQGFRHKMPQPQSFQTLRQQLDELGYFQILTLDALPLVEAILHDLVGARGKLKAQRKVVIRGTYT